MAANTKPQFWRTHHRATIIASCILAVLLLFLVLLQFMQTSPFKDAEQKLKAETSDIIVPSAMLEREEFHKGACLDNCPELRKIYRIDKNNKVDIRQYLLAELKRKGYGNIQSGAASLYGHKAPFEIRATIVNATAASDAQVVIYAYYKGE